MPTDFKVSLVSNFAGHLIHDHVTGARRNVLLINRELLFIPNSRRHNHLPRRSSRCESPGKLGPGWILRLGPCSSPRRFRRPGAVTEYTEDGRIDIDNNEAEREMKHIATGRKNWLFAASERGGRAAAIHFSLIATCRRHQVEPWAYLRDLLIRLPVLRDAGQLTPEHLRPLLPYLWRPQ